MTHVSLPRMALAIVLAPVLAAAALACADPASAGAAGARAQAAELRALKQRLDRLAEQGKAGDAQYWYIDHARGKVHIAVLRGADDSVTRGFAGSTPDARTITSVIDRPVTPYVGTVAHAPAAGRARRSGPVYGGQQITAGDSYCSTGFNVGAGPAGRVLTAGHCYRYGPSWYLGGDHLGEITRLRYPGGDVSEITPEPGWRLTGSVLQSDGSYQEIDSTAQVRLGQRLCKTGARTGTSCGVVYALDATADYGDGPIHGLAVTDLYAAEGDSGGPVYAGGTAIGLVSGGPQGGGPALVYPLY
ncbi:S1 family peptidase [Spongiactinospora sp. 9N601]